jgi:DNA-binding LacI/PurR family transcriptional regulator
MRVYEHFVKEHGLTSCKARLHDWNESSHHDFGSHFTPLFESDPDSAPTAVLTGDHTALLLLTYAKQRGWRIPEDLSILGIDNTLAARYCDPPLTTFDTRTDEIARQAVSLMFNRIKRPDRPCQMKRVPPQLVVRHSVNKLDHPTARRPRLVGTVN